MEGSLSKLVNNLSQGLCRIKCKLEQNDKTCETCEIRYKHCDCFLEYTDFKDDLIEQKYLTKSCNKIYQQNFNEKLKE